MFRSGTRAQQDTAGIAARAVNAACLQGVEGVTAFGRRETRWMPAATGGVIGGKDLHDENGSMFYRSCRPSTGLNTLPKTTLQM